MRERETKRNQWHTRGEGKREGEKEGARERERERRGGAESCNTGVSVSRCDF